jgi:hypothetical protein
MMRFEKHGMRINSPNTKNLKLYSHWIGWIVCNRYQTYVNQASPKQNQIEMVQLTLASIWPQIWAQEYKCGMEG